MAKAKKKLRWSRPAGDPPLKVSEAYAREAEIKNRIFLATELLEARNNDLENENRKLKSVLQKIIDDDRAATTNGQRIPSLTTAASGDAVNHPGHYTMGGIEVIDAIEAWGLGFNLGNCCKYVARAGKKDPTKTAEDLMKACFYLQREISRASGK